ncbi:MAG: class I SAM-dependent methyltransferase [Candidatus Aminicenantes bacterium]|nr:class I SAM-dependent methyltransferase [Candidatus Aminicenantes bacterium]
MKKRLHFHLLALSYKIRDLRRPRRIILEEVEIKPGDRVLDFGCGPGSYLLLLVEMVGPHGKIYALDINPLAIRMVQGLAERKQLKNISTIHSDGPTGLPDDYLDVVLLFDVFHHLEQPQAVLRELHRILRPGGILSVSDHHLKGSQIIQALTEGNLFKLSKTGRFTYSFNKI